ncbi:carboxypeptidase regulatory-like domain-containing protein [Paenibacillus sp. GCM10023250]|uniref:carboxypeptidase regulatory-like domain-containing protein n=1 Tax=Paenibacillus sp. GCM10023250 TaxID=3252648 RepID=UPI00361E67F3
MRLKIRLKVKHLVMGLAAVAVLLAVGYRTLPAVADLAGVQPAAGQEIRSREALLALLTHPPSTAKTWKLIQDYVLSDGTDTLSHGFHVYVGSNFVQTSGPDARTERPLLTWEEKLPLLLLYLNEGPADAKDTTYLVTAAKQLALYYQASGDIGRAIGSLETAERRAGNSQPYLSAQLQVERAKLLLQSGKDRQAEALIGEIQQAAAKHVDLDRDVKVAELEAQLLIRRGSLTAALESVKQAVASYQDRQKELTGLAGDANAELPVPLEQLQALQEVLLDRPKGADAIQTSAVSGTITRSDGQPMAYAGVFLRTSEAVNHSLLESEPYQTMTDAQGHYSFANVVPGAYQLTLGFTYDAIDGWAWPADMDEWIDVEHGKPVTYPVVLRPLIRLIAPVNDEQVTGSSITFRWEPVDGAAYYKLSGTIKILNEHGSSSIGVQIRNHLADSQVTLPVDELYNLTAGVLYDTIDDSQVPHPESLLGFANPGKRFSWSVEAYDEQGHKLSQSSGYRLTPNTMGELPYFVLNARQLTAGDRLLLANRMDEAMAAYQRAFAADPADVYSLGKIIKLYDVRDSAGKQAFAQEALPYRLHMLALRPDINNLFWLIQYYAGLGDWAKAEHYYALSLTLGRDDDLTYLQAEYSQALLKQGRFSEARALLAKLVQLDNSHAQIGPYLAADLCETGSFVHAAALAEQYPERKRDTNAPPKWELLISAMNEEAAGSGTYLAELQQALRWQYTGEAAALDTWKKSTEHPAMVSFLMALARK